MTNQIDAVSTDEAGKPLPIKSWSMSADGTVVVFGSMGYSLGSDNRYSVYVKNLTTGSLTLVSSEISTSPFSDSLPQTSDYAEELPNISLDGKNVVFSSYTTPDRPSATDGVNQVYLENLATGDLSLVSQTADGVAGDTTSYGAAVSAHGRAVAFSSTADNLIPGVDGGSKDPYVAVKDLQTGDLRLVSANAAGEVANAGSSLDSISAGGRFIAFQSSATNLVPQVTTSTTFDGYTKGEIYVKDMRTGALTLASATTDGVPSDGQSRDGSLSADGTKIAFTDVSTTLGQGGTSNEDVYVKDLVTGDLVLASSAADGTPADGVINSGPIISSDGRYVMFTSTADNLVPGVTSKTGEVYVKNLETGAIALLSQDASGMQSRSAQTDYVLDRGSAHLFSLDDTQTLFSASGLSSQNPDGADGLFRVTQSSPDVAFNPVAGNNFVGPIKARHSVLISGTSTEIGQQVNVSLDDASEPLGTATVGDDGTWRFRASLDGIAPGDHTVLATVQGIDTYLSTDASETFTYSPASASLPQGLASTQAIGSQSGSSGNPPAFVYTAHADMGTPGLASDGPPGGSSFIGLSAGSGPATSGDGGSNSWLKPNPACTG